MQAPIVLRGSTVFVTGSTGFLGWYLLEQLERAGAHVHALARATSQRGHLDHLKKVVWHTGELGDVESLRAALSSAAEAHEGRSANLGPGPALLVIHAAATISYRTDDSESMRRVNVEGTWNLLAAARRSQVRRVCFVSSLMAVGASERNEAVAKIDPEAVRSGGVNESAEFNLDRRKIVYAITKRAAEDIALQMTGEMEVCCVNPGAIFGLERPGVAQSNTQRFLEQLQAGRLGWVLPPGQLGVVSAEDVAAGCLAALERGRAGRRYILVESNWDLLRLAQAAAQHMGVRGPRWRFPGWLWAPVVMGAGWLDRMRRLELATPQALTMAGQSMIADASRARSELDWAPRPFTELLEQLCEQRRELSKP